MGFEVGVKVDLYDLYPQSRVVFSGVGIRRKRSKRITPINKQSESEPCPSNANHVSIDAPLPSERPRPN